MEHDERQHLGPGLEELYLPIVCQVQRSQNVFTLVLCHNSDKSPTQLATYRFGLSGCIILWWTHEVIDGKSTLAQYQKNCGNTTNTRLKDSVWWKCHIPNLSILNVLIVFGRFWVHVCLRPSIWPQWSARVLVRPRRQGVSGRLCPQVWTPKFSSCPEKCSFLLRAPTFKDVFVVDGVQFLSFLSCKHNINVDIYSDSIWVKSEGYYGTFFSFWSFTVP